MDKLIYKGRIFSLFEKPSYQGNGLRDVIVHPGAAGAIVLNARGNVVLIKQYREAIGDYIYEIPAGLLNDNESPEDCIRRELKEEIGASDGKVTFLRWFYTTPGFTNEKFYLYLVENPLFGDNQLDYDEVIEIIELPIPDMFEMLFNNKIIDSKTVIALFELKKYLDSSGGK